MLNMNKWLLSSVITLSLSGAAQATGTHEGGHTKLPAAGAAAESSEHAGHDMGVMTEKSEHAGHDMKEHHHDMEAQSKVGKPADKDAEITKTYTVHLTDDMRFNFSEKPELVAGDVVKFIVMNKGKINHELAIGSAEEQVAHREMMKQMPDMKHEDGSTVAVEPGDTKELIWQFAGTEQVQFACNMPGHVEAGMHQETDIQPGTTNN